MKVKFSPNFEKLLKLSPIIIQAAFHKRLTLFLHDPFHPLLRNHALKGEYYGTRSINVNGDWRALYQERGEVIYFVALGTHSQLYG